VSCLSASTGRCQSARSDGASLRTITEITLTYKRSRTHPRAAHLVARRPSQGSQPRQKSRVSRSPATTTRIGFSSLRLTAREMSSHWPRRSPPAPDDLRRIKPLQGYQPFSLPKRRGRHAGDEQGKSTTAPGGQAHLSSSSSSSSSLRDGNKKGSGPRQNKQPPARTGPRSRRQTSSRQPRTRTNLGPLPPRRGWGRSEQSDVGRPAGERLACGHRDETEKKMLGRRGVGAGGKCGPSRWRSRSASDLARSTIRQRRLQRAIGGLTSLGIGAARSQCARS
jgi:hypothetical protein